MSELKVQSAGGIECLESKDCRNGGLYVRAHEHNHVFGALKRSRDTYVMLAAEECDDKNALAAALTEIRALWLSARATNYSGDGANSHPYVVDCNIWQRIKEVVDGCDGLLYGGEDAAMSAPSAKPGEGEKL